jgi:hypothetical protein
METGDRIILLRGVLGVIAGVICFVLTIITGFQPTSSGYISISIFTASFLYAMSVVFVKAVFQVQGGKWLLLGKGFSVFISSWLLSWSLILILRG